MPKRDAVDAAARKSLHKQSKFLLDTSIIGYTLIRHTPGGDQFIINDHDREQLFSVSVSSHTRSAGDNAPGILPGTERSSNWMVWWSLSRTAGMPVPVRIFPDLYIDENTKFAWADPSYQQTYATLLLEQQKRDEQQKKNDKSKTRAG